MNNTSTMIVTGTKAALAKLAKRVNGTVQENARNGALFVAVACSNGSLSLSADARSDGSVAYRTADQQNHVAATQAEFLAKCRGFTPSLQECPRRFVDVSNGYIMRIG